MERKNNNLNTKKMKRFIIIAILSAGILFAGKANAQTGIHLGYSPEAWTSENSSLTLSSIFVGANHNLSLTGDLKLNIGGQLRYGTESGSSSLWGIVSGKHTTTIIGLDVPVLFNYGLSLGKDLTLAIFAGPKFTFNLSGKTHYEGSVLGLGGSSDQEWFNDKSGSLNLKPFNAAVMGGLSLDFRQFRLFGGYSYGLTDVDNSNNTATKVGGPFFGLGYSL